MVLEKLSSSTDLHTGRNFAIAWKVFPRLDERYKKQFLDWIFPVDAEFFQNKLVFEGGCGKGRHARIVSASKARAVFAVDIGEAVDIAYRHVGHEPNVHVIQADIANLPFEPIFDFAFSVGVLHHLDKPKEGFLSIASKLKSDGSIAVWVYGQENNWWLIYLVNPFRKAITSKLPPKVLLVLSAALASPVYLWAKLVARPWQRLTERHRFLPHLYYQEYLSYIADFDFVEIYHIVFDHLVTPVAFYVSRDCLQEWFEQSGLPEPVIRWHNKNSWTAFSSLNRQTLDNMKERLKKRATGGNLASASGDDR
jgi:SAM-dependent methyltransferase